MMTPLAFTLEADYPLYVSLCKKLEAECGKLQYRSFPDGETYLRVESPVDKRNCLIVANLVDPNPRFLPLIFLADSLRELGAASVGIVAPYLCYMRQDCRFRDGEAVTSRVFARLLSAHFDWLVTVDPHLHRYKDLSEIYAIPTQAVHGAAALADWLQAQPQKYLLVGPDVESEQWVQSIAARLNRPYVVGRKERRGDREVVITLPELSRWSDHNALIIDDVISSGRTILETIDVLKACGFKAIDCAAIHGIFADEADTRLQRRLSRLITSNSVPHWSNAVDLCDTLAGPVKQQLEHTAGQTR